MFKKIYNLIKILRKLAVSDAVNTLNNIKPIPISLKFVFFIFSIGKKKQIEKQKKKESGEALCEALENMGTTFIKLGQFLATRPDIIGEDVAKKLEKLQDKLPAFDTAEAKIILKKEIGDKYFKDILSFSDPIAAASIAQVHFAKVKIKNEEKELAIKILRPNIHVVFNEELDALIFFAYLVENFFKKTRRLRLVKVM